MTHEAPLELIKQHPALAVDLLRAVTSEPLPDLVDVRLNSTSLNEAVPVEFRADAVVVVSNPATSEPIAVIVVEPQGRDEKTKRLSWPAYLANVRRAVNCESAFLIVVCPDPAEAEKCRRAIPMGHPGWDLRPIVIDPDHAPGADVARPYLLLFLACLPALDLETEAGARRVLEAIQATGASDDERKILTTIILVRASETARRILEGLMTTMEWKSDFIESFVAEGLQKGLQEGREEGRVQARREDVVKVLDSRGLRPTSQQVSELAACTDLTRLDLWFERSLAAATAEDVFKD
jgi:hypothetical protein